MSSPFLLPSPHLLTLPRDEEEDGNQALTEESLSLLFFGKHILSFGMNITNSDDSNVLGTHHRKFSNGSLSGAVVGYGI